MKKNISTLLFSIFMVSISFAQTIDSTKSKVSFNVSNLKFRTVTGSFSGMNGEVNLNTNNSENSTLDVCIDASTVNTDNTKRDDHLRTSDFFDTQKFPTICFKSNTISSSNGNFIAKGKLTMHGITKEVEIPLALKNNILTGTLTLNRLDYGIGEDTSKFMVGNEVKIEITCAVKQ